MITAALTHTHTHTHTFPHTQVKRYTYTCRHRLECTERDGTVEWNKGETVLSPVSNTHTRL